MTTAMSALDEQKRKVREAGDAEKVLIRLKSIGNAPILSTTLFKITASHQFGHINSLLRKKLNLDDSESLYTYVNFSFCPSMEDTILDLYKLFGINGCLIVN